MDRKQWQSLVDGLCSKRANRYKQKNAAMASFDYAMARLGYASNTNANKQIKTYKSMGKF